MADDGEQGGGGRPAAARVRDHVDIARYDLERRLCRNRTIRADSCLLTATTW
jgi:hypothetical protein